MLRALRLVGMAAAAETQRLKVQAQSTVDRYVYLAIAGVFAFFAAIMLHLGLWVWLVRFWGPVGGAFGVLALDLVGAGIFYLLSSRTGRDPAVIEAKTVRDVALAGATEELFYGAAKRSAPWAALGGLAFALMRRNR